MLSVAMAGCKQKQWRYCLTYVRNLGSTRWSQYGVMITRHRDFRALQCGSSCGDYEPMSSPRRIGIPILPVSWHWRKRRL